MIKKLLLSGLLLLLPGWAFAAPYGQFSGSVDSKGIATGTAGDNQSFSQPVNVQFQVDGISVGTLVGVSTGMGTFQFQIPSIYLDGKPHSLYGFPYYANSSVDPTVKFGPLQFTVGSVIVTTPKNCVPVTGTVTQNCQATITITGGVPPYTIQRKDGAGPLTDIKTTSATVVQDVFTDTGNMIHAYDAVDSVKTKSNVELWTTPPIAQSPPPTKYPTVPPDPSIIIVTASDTWTLGAESTTYPGNYLILRNGKSLSGAIGSRIALCQNTIYVVGRNLNYWSYIKNTWKDTGLKKLPCD
jgi:hypothetical protein